MTKRFHGTVVCPTFIGRDRVVADVRGLVDAARAGAGSALLVGGEAGIGKSRLVAEAATYATSCGMRAMQGNCYATDQNYPYAPLLDLLRTFNAQTPDVATESERSLFKNLAQLLPEIALWTPDSAAETPPLRAEPEQEQRQLFAALTRFFTQLAQRHPLLLIVEDIHWCDDISLEYVLHLARACQDAPLLLLLTYRSDEPRPRLYHWLARISQERLAREFMLEPLGRADVAAMLQATLPEQPGLDAALVSQIASRAEGNPFFVEELLKSLMLSGALAAPGDDERPLPAPRTVQEVVQQRVARLSQAAQQFVTLAAVAGRRFDVSLLQTLLGCDEAGVVALLKEVVAAQLVVEEAADQFLFRHALTQEAIAATLLARERQAFHRAIAEALEARAKATNGRDRNVAELAYHSLGGGRWDQALAYAQEAAEKALALYAQQAAVGHLTRAIDAAHHLDMPPLARLYLTRGKAHETVGEFDRARGDYERALSAARDNHEAALEWQSLLSLGFLWSARDYDQAGKWFQDALTLADTLGDPLLRARSLNRLGNWLVNIGRNAEGREAHHAALTIFTERDDTRGMAETLDLLGTAYGLHGDRVNSVRYQGQALERFRALGDARNLISILATRAIQSTPETCETLYQAIRSREEYLSDAEESMRLARHIGSLSDQAFAEFALAETRAFAGDLAAALAHAQTAWRLATEIGHKQWMVVAVFGLGDIALQLLQPAQAHAALEQGFPLARELRSEFWIGMLAALQAQAYLQEQQSLPAAALLAATQARDMAPHTLAQRQIAWMWGEVTLAQGDPAWAVRRVEMLLASAPGDPQDQPIPHLLKLKGAALAALSRFSEAEAALRAAQHGAILRRDQTILWRIEAARAHLYHRMKRDDAAGDAREAGQAIITQLATSLPDDAERLRFTQAALALFPASKPRLTKREKAPGALSAREREVAALVAQGKSNRQIADALVVSERTAEAHVSNILGKLGFAARAQIAAWAVEQHALGRE